MFKTNFSGHNKVGGAKKFKDTAPECPHGYGPGLK